MIPRSAITHWNKQVPWEDIANVEQDLIITRALTDIFSDEFLASELAFRGGTALHKLYLAPQPRYSEDIDLVQINPGPIKPILFRLGEVLDYLPDKVIKPKRFNNTMLFRIQSEIPPVVQIRLKVEINCGLSSAIFVIAFRSASRILYRSISASSTRMISYHSASCRITSYSRFLCFSLNDLES